MLLNRGLDQDEYQPWQMTTTISAIFGPGERLGPVVWL